MNYAQVHLSDHTLVGTPAPLPANLIGLTNEVLADLSAHIDPPPSGLAGMGLWPAVVTALSYDPSSQVVEPPTSWTVDTASRTVQGTATVRAMTAEEFAAANPVPDSVTNYQARRALRAAGLFDEVDTAIRGAGNPTYVDAWDYANVFLRGDDVIAAMTGALKMTGQQVDDLFRAAAKFA